MRRIKIFDTTLRDGEQSPGIALRPDEKAEIARALELLGVDIIEAGFAASSPGDFQGVAAVVDVGDARDRRIACPNDRRRHRRRRRRRSRARRAAASTSSSRRARCTWSASSGSTPAEVLERIAWAVAYAAEHADEVEFSAEDATRSDRAFLAGPAARRSRPARRSSTCRTPSAITTPDEYARMFDDLRERCPELGGVELSVHCHDDLGLAVANSLAGIEAGATQVECTVNGIGERAGNAALEEVVMALRVRADALRRRDRRRSEHDPRRVGARGRADRLRGAAQQADRRRERIRARGRHPPGRDAQGRVARTRSSIRPSSASR